MSQNIQYRISNCSVVECNGSYVPSGALRHVNKASKYTLEHVPGKGWKIAIGKNSQYETNGDASNPSLCNWFDSVTKKLEDIEFVYYVEVQPRVAEVDGMASPSAVDVAPNASPLPKLELHYSANNNYSGFSRPASKYGLVLA
jgi:hypothetical protein